MGARAVATGLSERVAQCGAPDPLHRHQQAPLRQIADNARKYEVNKTFEGVLPNLERRWRETDSAAVREDLARYQAAKPCPQCQGTRLRREARHVRLAAVGDPAAQRTSRHPQDAADVERDRAYWDAIWSIRRGMIEGLLDPAQPFHLVGADAELFEHQADDFLYAARSHSPHPRRSAPEPPRGSRRRGRVPA